MRAPSHMRTSALVDLAAARAASRPSPSRPHRDKRLQARRHGLHQIVVIHPSGKHEEAWIMGLIARHPRPPELVNVNIEEIARRYVARFGERKPDWHAFADAAIDGYRRAQHRFIGNTSGKPDANFIPARAFTLSVMFVPPGEGNASHTHEVEEVFFVLQGRLIVFFEEEDG